MDDAGAFDTRQNDTYVDDDYDMDVEGEEEDLQRAIALSRQEYLRIQDQPRWPDQPEAGPSRLPYNGPSYQHFSVEHVAEGPVASHQNFHAASSETNASQPIAEPFPTTAKQSKQPRKSARTKSKPAVAPTIQQTKTKNDGGKTRRNARILKPGEPKWSVVKSKGTDTRPPERPTSLDLHPRIWTSGKEELFASVPNLAKCVNGIAWQMTDLPHVVLDEDNVITILRDPATKNEFMELVIVREFVCLSTDLMSFPVVDVSKQQQNDRLGGDVIPPVPSGPSAPSNAVSGVQLANLGQQVTDVDSLPDTAAHYAEPFTAQPSRFTVLDRSVKTELLTESAHQSLLITATPPISDPNGPDELPGMSNAASGTRAFVDPSMVQSGAAQPFENMVVEDFHWTDFDVDVRAFQTLTDRPVEGHPSRAIAEPTSAILPGTEASSHPAPGQGEHPGAATLWRFNDAKVEPLAEECFPIQNPPEIKRLTEAYIEGDPIVAIASNAVLKKHWGVYLPDEFSMAFLGMFKLCSIKERRLPDPKLPGGTEHAVGRVEWRFRCMWKATHEEYIEAKDKDVPCVPWWLSSPPPLPTEADLVDDSSPRYRNPRTAHPNFKWDDLPLWNLYVTLVHDILTLRLDAPMTRDTLPQGWFCKECNKVNFQAWLRHRRCTSSFCAHKPLPKGHPRTLYEVREPSQSNVAMWPLNSYPRSVDGTLVHFKDNTKTFSYFTCENDTGACVKHVFAGNWEPLQADATTLFGDIQTDVWLRRRIGDSGPYFTYTIGKSGSKGSNVIAWEDAPACLHRARNILLAQANDYGDMEDRRISINQLVVLAWLTIGSKKGADVLTCKKHPYVVMCLGCEAEISLLPQSGFRPSDASTFLDDALFGLGGHAGGALMNDDEDDATQNPGDGEAILGIALGSNKKSKGSAKKTKKEEIRITLYHGDVMILLGDDFQYSIKRSGPSILLIGSTV